MADDQRELDLEIEYTPEKSLHKTGKLINISVLANILSWIVLITSILFFIFSGIQIYLDISSASYFNFFDFYLYLLMLAPALICLSFYAILRFISESIPLLLDMHIDFQEAILHKN
jgi:hypothetical protein